NHGDLLADQIGHLRLQPLWLVIRPSISHGYVLSLDEPGLIQPSLKCGKKVSGTGCCRASSKPDHRHRRLLRACHERPRDDRAAEQRYELAAPHSITSSDSASNLSGISRPSAFAVWRLITNSNLVGCSTGKSAGLAPFRIRST